MGHNIDPCGTPVNVICLDFCLAYLKQSERRSLPSQRLQLQVLARSVALVGGGGLGALRDLKAPLVLHSGTTTAQVRQRRNKPPPPSPASESTSVLRARSRVLPMALTRQYLHLEPHIRGFLVILVLGS